MKRRLCVTLLSLVVAAGCATTSKPVETVGDLTAKGGKKLTSAEIRTLVTGSTLEGPAPGTGNPFRTVLSPDGALKGEVRGRQGSIGLEGTWSVNDQDQFCTALTKPRPSSDCAFLYSANGTHYGALTDEPKADVLERRFSK